jgi:hypothetical protein
VPTVTTGVLTFLYEISLIPRVAARTSKRVTVLVNWHSHNNLWWLLLFHLLKCSVALSALLARSWNVLNHLVTRDTELGAHGRCTLKKLRLLGLDYKLSLAACIHALLLWCRNMKGIVAEVAALDGNWRLTDFGNRRLRKVLELALLSRHQVVCGIQVHQNVVDLFFFFFTQNLSVVEIENFISRDYNLWISTGKFRKSNHSFLKNGVLLLRKRGGHRRRERGGHCRVCFLNWLLFLWCLIHLAQRYGLKKFFLNFLFLNEYTCTRRECNRRRRCQWE